MQQKNRISIDRWLRGKFKIKKKQIMKKEKKMESSSSSSMLLFSINQMINKKETKNPKNIRRVHFKTLKTKIINQRINCNSLRYLISRIISGRISSAVIRYQQGIAAFQELIALQVSNRINNKPQQSRKHICSKLLANSLSPRNISKTQESKQMLLLQALEKDKDKFKVEE